VNVNKTPVSKMHGGRTSISAVTRFGDSSFVLAAGHPSPAVRSAAGKLEPQLFTAAVQAEWHVADVIKGRDNAEHLSYAQKGYDNAVTALADLEREVNA